MANGLYLLSLVVPAVSSNRAIITGPSFKKIVFILRYQQDRSELTSLENYYLVGRLTKPIIGMNH
ncbi:hypothetical protein [Fructilactobacillus sanfranciscensis]|uniref:hypothetical protein n=1 Tax=Fructilactobacillus sanfranciscensis TaxID=1625 RepID=UPI0023AB4616|nr:hypothetical protein [Fructilactobacillus sanfranciscensis]WED57551.1 hypothetical protein PY770_00800 [Fructilactobacillus sanfranciscensis]